MSSRPVELDYPVPRRARFEMQRLSHARCFRAALSMQQWLSMISRIAVTGISTKIDVDTRKCCFGVLSIEFEYRLVVLLQPRVLVVFA